MHEQLITQRFSNNHQNKQVPHKQLFMRHPIKRVNGVEPSTFSLGS